MSAAQLTDFGLAKSAATGSKYTRSGQALGTPAYMSPEQARGEASALTPATDVWGIGCILYELLAGRRPFEGETTAAVVARVLHSEPLRLRAIRDDVPEPVERVIRVCLGKRAGERYRDAGALRADLDRVLQGERPRARLPGARRSPVTAVALVTGIAATAAGLAFLRTGARPDSAPGSVTTAPGAILAAQARAMRQMDPREAAKLLAEALALSGTAEPSRDAWRLERGVMLWAIGEGPQARAEWDQIPAGAREGATARLYRGLEAWCRFQALEARPDLQASAAAGGPEGRLATGALAVLDADWVNARAVLRGVEGWEAALLRACVEGAGPGGDSRAALREYGQALEEGIPFAWAYHNRASVRESHGDTAGAIADYDRALALAPQLEPALLNRAIARGTLGDLAGALDDYDRVLELDPGHAPARFDRGNLRRDRGDLAGAIADYDRVLELDPQHVAAARSRGRVRQVQGDLAGAIADYDRTLALDPQDAVAVYHRGRARDAQGDLAGAIADYDRALEIRPGHADTLVSRGVARRTEGHLAAAIADLDRALEIDPHHADAYGNRGVAHAMQGNLGGALADLEKALELAPPQWSHRAAAERDLARVRALLAAQGAPK